MVNFETTQAFHALSHHVEFLVTVGKFQDWRSICKVLPGRYRCWAAICWTAPSLPPSAPSVGTHVWWILWRAGLHGLLPRCHLSLCLHFQLQSFLRTLHCGTYEIAGWKKIKGKEPVDCFQLGRKFQLEMLKFKKDSPLKHHFQYQQFKVTLQLCVKNLLASDWTSSLWCWAGIRKSQTLLNSCQKACNEHLNPAIENALCMLETSLASLPAVTWEAGSLPGEIALLRVLPRTPKPCRFTSRSTKMSQRPGAFSQAQIYTVNWVLLAKEKETFASESKVWRCCAPHSIPFPFPGPSSCGIKHLESDLWHSGPWTFCPPLRAAPTILRMLAEASWSQKPTEANSQQQTKNNRRQKPTEKTSDAF